MIMQLKDMTLAQIAKWVDDGMSIHCEPVNGCGSCSSNHRDMPAHECLIDTPAYKIAKIALWAGDFEIPTQNEVY